MWKVRGGLGREDTPVRRETEDLRMKRPEGEWEIQVRIRSTPPHRRPKAADKEGRRQRAITNIQHAGAKKPQMNEPGCGSAQQVKERGRLDRRLERM